MKIDINSYIDKKFEINVHTINENGYRWLDTENLILESSKSFANSFNQLQLVFNYYTNLHVFEDLRHYNGMSTYGIDIPLSYFRFPPLNDPRQPSNKTMSENEELLLNNIVSNCKTRLNYCKDETIIEEMAARFEFLSLYSYFEGFCEELLFEKAPLKDDKTRKSICEFIIRHNLLDIIKEVFNKYDSQLHNKIISKYKDFDSIMNLFYRARNLYTHNNGLVTKRFINFGLKTPSFLEDSIFSTVTEKKYTITCIYGEYTIWESKVLGCQMVNSYFRALSTIIVEMLNFEEKMSSVSS